MAEDAAVASALDERVQLDETEALIEQSKRLSGICQQTDSVVMAGLQELRQQLAASANVRQEESPLPLRHSNDEYLKR